MAQQVIQHFGKGGFDVITRGQVPPNPSELLMRDRMRQLLEWANDHYDLVIVDTPPMLAVSEPVVDRSVGTSLLVGAFWLEHRQRGELVNAASGTGWR